MRYNIAAYLLSLVSLCIFVNAQQQQQRTCSGGYKEGDQVDRGRYWYLCQEGQLVPKGCFTDTKQRISLSESFETGGYVMACVIDANGYLSFEYKGCVYEGRRYGIAETWQDDKYWYTCTKEGEALRMDVSGCAFENRRYNVSVFYSFCF